jgi:acetylornithine/succinyldiaminopimelate/putrescine aminotransferase
MLEGVRFVPPNDVEALRAAMDEKVCAIVLEPIQGEGGIQVSTPAFLQACREQADQHQAALVFDEIQCGLGRTGQLFAFQHFGVTPDVVCIAKPIAAGLPLGAFLAKEQFAQHITPGKHGTTFGGGPLTCRVALEYLAILEDENLLERVRRVGDYLSQKLRELVDKFDIAVEVRGVGAIQALQLNIPGKPVMDGALADGLLINVTQDNVLRFLPPFLLEEKHVDKGVRILRKQLAAAQKQAKADKKTTAISA